MSKSINDLIGILTKNKNPQPLEGELDNPDIPSGLPNEKTNIRDQFYNVFKKPSSSRNGTFSLGPNRIFKDRVKEAFSYNSSIDPNVIRSKVDPDNAIPSLGTLNGDSLYSLDPESLRKPKSQVSLIKKSHQSELNYRNRFVPSGQDVIPLKNIEGVV